MSLTNIEPQFTINLMKTIEREKEHEFVGIILKIQDAYISGFDSIILPYMMCNIYIHEYALELIERGFWLDHQDNDLIIYFVNPNRKPDISDELIGDS